MKITKPKFVSTEEVLKHSNVKTYKDKVAKLKRLAPPDSLIHKIDKRQSNP